MILGIDPGMHDSAAVLYDGERVLWASHFGNAALLRLVSHPDMENRSFVSLGCRLAIEGVESFGKPVGKEVFATCIWIGRFIQAWELRRVEWSLIYRSEVKLALCNSRTAKDSFVRQALLDKFGPGRELAVGVKKRQGPLYGVSKHAWQALAVAVTAEILASEPNIRDSVERAG